MALDPSRLFTQLLNTNLQGKDPQLYQLIHDLIALLLGLNLNINRIGGSISNVTNNNIIGNPSSLSDGSSGEDNDMLSIPGPIGLSGKDGLIGIPGLDGLDGEDALVIPGPIGATGATGPAGIDGIIGVPGFDGIDGEDLLSIPGPQGPAGNDGIQGLTGPIGFGIDGQDGEDSLFIPGSPGPTGSTGLTGDAGPIGPPGYGFDGDDGDITLIPGTSGANGSDGVTGAAGPIGPPGISDSTGDNASDPDILSSPVTPVSLLNYTPSIGIQRVAWVQAVSGTSVGAGVAQSTPTNASNLVDVGGCWTSLTSAVSGQVSSWGFNNAFGIVDAGFTFIARIRTGVSVANVRLYVGVKTNAFTDSDTLSTKGIAFRYSTVASDGGWVGVTNDGTQSVSGTIAAIVASTVYILKIRVNSTSVAFSVNGGAETTITTHIPTGIAALGAQSAMIPQTAATRALDINVLAIYDGPNIV